MGGGGVTYLGVLGGGGVGGGGRGKGLEGVHRGHLSFTIEFSRIANFLAGGGGGGEEEKRRRRRSRFFFCICRDYAFIILLYLFRGPGGRGGRGGVEGEVGGVEGEGERPQSCTSTRRHLSFFFPILKVSLNKN